MVDVPTTNGASAKPTIVLIHGLWMSPSCWEEWISFFASKGYTAIAPGWPGLDGRTVEDIRAHPEALQGVTIGAIINNYIKIIETLPSPPILMGHSFGGLFVQILLSKGFGIAGVGISPAQPSGVLTLKLTTVKAGFGVLGNPLNYNKAVKITESQFHYNFGNHLNAVDSKVLWEKYSIPAAGHILFQGVLGLLSAKSEGSVDFGKKNRAPLLLIAGTNDHVVPRQVVEAERKHYVGPAVVELKVFEGRTHGIVNQKGWEEVADDALKWVEEKTKV
ncbi:alpha/beta-hydrolase [Mollisia scopiformis]|uniref:Alpha/beta-hydrolase n=1 Tax=Mollisia scopiformis TaxID=149040 RepID=A0A194XK01_MOLSC|nr:alpha/beta-hydrolase [Mollisia scopiformis]KUJ20555.1 alpha/beta-hydrolase [Mollisia scopiformis]